MKLLWLTIASLGLSGCATGYNPMRSFNYVQVINLSGGEIREASLRVVAAEKTVACERVAKNAICDERFGTRRYPLQGLELSWVHPDGSRKTEVLNPHVPAYYFSSLPLQIYLEIREDGSVRPFYKQEEPGRDGSIFDD